ncbi:MAG: GNAT family N-acetyltransferase [Acidobacteria bacterium]|nr:GNAT family N-acetyltransferase [Acidobacteriota bacterium]
MDDVTLRPITDADREFLLRVYAGSRREEMALSGWDEDRIAAFLAWQFQLQHDQYVANYPGAEFDVVLAGGVPVGRLYVHRHPDEIRIMDIAVLPEHRGRGIGARLMAGLVAESDARGVPLGLHVETLNPARDWYRVLGFREGELRGVYYYMERAPRGRVEAGERAATPRECECSST